EANCQATLATFQDILQESRTKRLHSSVSSSTATTTTTITTRRDSPLLKGDWGRIAAGCPLAPRPAVGWKPHSPRLFAAACRGSSLGVTVLLYDRRREGIPYRHQIFFLSQTKLGCEGANRRRTRALCRVFISRIRLRCPPRTV